MSGADGVIEAQCRNCIAWKETEATGPVTVGAPRRGVCYGVPPTPYPRFAGQQLVGQMDLRPCPAADNGCLLFQPRADLIPADPPPH